MAPKDGWHGPTPLSRLIKGAIDPVLAKRGFAAADLIGSWDTIVGQRYAACTRPEQIKWPQQRGGAAVLTVSVDGGQAVYLQHELDQVIERINGFLGYEAVGDIRLVQRTAARTPARNAPDVPLPEREERALERTVEGVEDDRLRSSLRRLGEGVARKRLARP
jgi:hypothetical protein